MERHAAAVAINEGKMNEFKKKLVYCIVDI